MAMRLPNFQTLNPALHVSSTQEHRKARCRALLVGVVAVETGPCSISFSRSRRAKFLSQGTLETLQVGQLSYSQINRVWLRVFKAPPPPPQLGVSISKCW